MTMTMTMTTATRHALLFSLSLVAFSLSLAPAFAIGISVSPARITAAGEAGEPVAVRMKVENPSDEVALIEAYADAAESVIAVSPRSFTLEPREERFVTVTVSSAEERQIDTMVSVVSRPLAGDGLRAGSGVKVPLHAEISPASRNRLLAAISSLTAPSGPAAAAFLALAAGFFAGRFARRKSRV